MKKLIGISYVAVVAFLLLLQTSVTSCTKEKTIIDTVVVTKRDTLVVTKKDTIVMKDTAISIMFLSNKVWILDEVRGVSANTILYYKRGAAGNTQNFDSELIYFNENKTGAYIDANGQSHTMTWDFLNSENTKLTFTISNPPPYPFQTTIYENLRFKNGQLLFDQYWSYEGVNHHAQGVRKVR
ncbi:hypothetical protein [Pseudocnuella soli]|uniref:hypothetical protein n=1 Tax=Pseudocnuella soli TaxID=2502779 RepID=UPI00104FF109|nr:hypothetical protein [Pseudocnuella soli]